ncbi:transcription factor bHLH143 [Manihot esculenta]|uniref:BHLH domain-containing protein n=1 Tax=Manihot esculenta TaxID=3983 RepID=A0A2C9V534_MANES|nr:transcription factor bHLH143 [Manihot esculenta]OAY39527.1 hypothetical protein MANES_10G102100v8 [Manihot esculenta]
MVKANSSWLFPPHCTGQSQNLNCMSTSVEAVQPGYLPACANSGLYTLSANVMMPGVEDPSLPSLNSQQSNGYGELPHSLPPFFQNSFPAICPCPKENFPVFPNGFCGEASPNAIPGCQQKFAIFDQSGNETRLIYSAFLTADVKPTVAAIKPVGGSCLRNGENAAKMDQINQTVLKLPEVSDENNLSGEESEMHEDTEEINALLYSDDEDDEYTGGDEDDEYVGGGGGDDDDYDDEVTSTGHSPFLISSSGMRGHVEDITEEVAGSDGQNKRQKLLDGGCKRKSLADTASLTELAGVRGYVFDNEESSYAFGQNQVEERLVVWGNKQLKKDKIRATLKILESIIPGAKDKDPLLVLDVAIDYLKSLKFKAKTLGVNYF